MDKILENIKTRRSVRRYRPDAVPQEFLDKIAEAGLFAASGRGRQGTLILQITDKAIRDRLSAMNAAIMGCDGDPFYGAPALFVVLSNREYSTYVYDGSLVMGNMMLEAHALGLGSCWIHRAKEEFDSEEGKEILRSLGIEGNYEGIGHLIVGYPDGVLTEASERKAGRIICVK